MTDDTKFAENQHYTKGFAYLDSYGILHYAPDKPKPGRDERQPKFKKLTNVNGYAGYVVFPDGSNVDARFNREKNETTGAGDYSGLVKELAALEGWL
jgi:hypothetical protein